MAIVNLFKDIPVYTPPDIPDNKQTFEKAKTLQIGYGSKVFRADNRGIWLGAEQPEDAPFWVDMEGNMVATSLDLSSYLQVGDSLDDIQALIGDISDINSDLGTIVAGSLIGLTITGGVVRTSSSGARVVMDGDTDQLAVYDATRKRMYLDSDELVFINSSGTETAHLTASTYSLEIDTSGGAWAGWIFSPTYGVYFMSDTDVVAVISDAGISMNNGRDIIMNGGEITGIDEIVFDKTTRTPNADGEVLHYDNGSTQSMRVQMDGVDFTFDLSFL